MTTQKITRLIQYFDQFEHFSVAVSGGIDSMVLAYLAHKFSTAQVTVVHACSPAVPESALTRIKHYAQSHQWLFKQINAGEFSDENYLKNPVNRCYFCKSNLYSRIAEHSQGQIFSGTNLDDLKDFRPGLEAAKELQVKHPYVEAGINKADIYQIAKHYNLNDLQCLAAQPCLASRVETGISIKTQDMVFIDDVEVRTRKLFPTIENVRCRITLQGIFVELDEIPASPALSHLSSQLNDLCNQQGHLFSGVRLYQKGSAFLNGLNHGLDHGVTHG